jgi:hypothetical protein
MMFRVVLAASAAVFLVSTAARAQQTEPAQTSGAAAETANRIIDKKGLGLSPAQGQLIVDLAKNEKAQTVGGDLSIGKPVPESMMLVEFPVEVKDQIGLLRDFKFARLENETIVLVDPTSRVVVDVIQN